MKTNTKLLALSGAVLLAGLISGCATGASTSGSMGMSGMGEMNGGPMDMQAMCQKHQNMMAGKSIAEQQALMDEHMKTMSPEMRARMQAMHANCTVS